MRSFIGLSLLLLATLTAPCHAQQPPTSDTPASQSTEAQDSNTPKVKAEIANVTSTKTDAYITLRIPADLLQPPPPPEPALDPSAPLTSLGSFTIPFTDDKGNTGTAIMMITAIRQIPGKKGAPPESLIPYYTLETRYFRLNKDKIEQFDAFTIRQEEIPVFAENLQETEIEKASVTPTDKDGHDISSTPFRIINGAKYHYHFSRYQLASFRRVVNTGRQWIVASNSWYRDYTQRLSLSNSTSTDSRLGTGGGKSTPGTDVFVNGYYRKDGTYVHSYTRSRPGTKSGGKRGH
jgi:hypothetical protein